MAGNLEITLDFNDVIKNIPRLNSVVEGAKREGLKKIADEILRLSQQQVPHDKGFLQNSGHVEDTNPDEVLVGYNKVYAARLHEHPEYNFQGGRKGKYMEDPIKSHTDTFRQYFIDSLRRVL